MRKSWIGILLVTAMAITLIAGCAQQPAQQSGESASSTESTTTDSAEDKSEDIEGRVNELVSKMTTEQKLAQMMIVPLRSDADNNNTTQEISSSYADVLKKYDFGGIILYAGNIVDPKQTVTFIHDSQAAAMDSEQGIPLFISLDEEGGMVSRLPYGVTGSGNMALEATGDDSLIAESATLLGKSIASVGFNMNFAPVSDVNNNPNNPIIGTRSFSDDPNTVAEDVVTFNNAMRETGVATALKHFPGHGNVGSDSHTGLPSSDLSVDELKKCELVPFQAGIEAGADMIMTAHIQFPNIVKETYVSKDDGKEITLPATLSHDIITDLLRKDLGYDGIVITDDMNMGAITQHFDPIDASVLAVNAGVDILLGPVMLCNMEGVNTLTEVDEYMSAMLERIEAGDISEERLNESVARILKTKIERGIMDNTAGVDVENRIAEAEALASDKESLEADWEITQKAITLLKNEDGMLPLDGTDGTHTLILYPSDTRQPTVEYAVEQLLDKGELAKDATSAVCYAELKASDETLQSELSKADQVLLLSQEATRNEEVAKVVEQAQKDGKKVALLSLGVPYDAACYAEADAVICAYQPYGAAHDPEGNGPVNMNVAVALFDAFGDSVPQGTLPVNVPAYVEADEGADSEDSEAAQGTFSTTETLYERGFGLQDWGA